jgi:Ca2+-transporting ATPase
MYFIGVDTNFSSIMKKPPQNVKNSFFAGGLWQRIAAEGLMIGLLAVIAFGIGRVYFDPEGSFIIARTMAFATLSISQLFHAFNVRSEVSIFKSNIKSNMYLVGAFFAGIILQVGVVQSPLHNVFRVIPLELHQWGIVFALSVVPIFVVEMQKKFAA